MPLLDKVKRLQEAGFEVQAGFIMGLDSDPEDIAEQMIAFIRSAGIPVAMVGILGVLRDTPDYRRFKRAGRLIEGAKYRGDSGVFSRQLSFVPKIDPDLLIKRHRQVVEALNRPEIFFERCLTLFDHQLRRAVTQMPVGWSEIRALLHSIWKQGVRGSYRGVYWRFLAQTLIKHPGRLADAVRLAVQGHHLIVTTQQALHVDEVKTFLEVAVARLEDFAQGSREALLQVEAYASVLMHRLQGQFVHRHDEKLALKQNADLLVAAAHDYYETVAEEFRHQVKEPMERFHRGIERILSAYAG